MIHTYKFDVPDGLTGDDLNRAVVDAATTLLFDLIEQTKANYCSSFQRMMKQCAFNLIGNNHVACAGATAIEIVAMVTDNIPEYENDCDGTRH